jgi:hypothetical protein
MANGGGNGFTKWFPVAWPVGLVLVTALITSLSNFYSTKEAIEGRCFARIEQVRTEERAYQEEMRSRYPTTERMQAWQTQEQQSINELRIAIALLQQEVHEWRRAAR